MKLPFLGSRRTRAAPLPKHWQWRRQINSRPGAALAPPVIRRSRRPRDSSSSDLRRLCREPRTAGDTLPLAPSPVVLHLATTCRDRARIPPVPPETFGDIVGDY